MQHGPAGPMLGYPRQHTSSFDSPRNDAHAAPLPGAVSTARISARQGPASGWFYYPRETVT